MASPSPEERFAAGEITEEQMNQLLSQQPESESWWERNMWLLFLVGAIAVFTIFVLVYLSGKKPLVQPEPVGDQQIATSQIPTLSPPKPPIAKPTLAIAEPTQTGSTTTATNSSAIASELQKLRGELEELRRQPAPAINFPSELSVRLLSQDSNSPILTQPQTQPEPRRRLSDKEAADKFWQDWLQRGP